MARLAILFVPASGRQPVAIRLGSSGYRLLVAAIICSAVLVLIGLGLVPLAIRDLASRSAFGDASRTSETGQDRWATVLDAVALSPVHLRVVPAGLPTEPGDQLLDVVKRVSMSVPAIAAAFGIEPTAPPRARRGRPRG